MPDSDVGTYFGKYFLLKKLAAGGMGEVFLAKQQGPAGFEKILVVKKVLPHLTENKEFVELFLSEARLSARMNHRNIVQVFELGEENGIYFIAMEFVQGKALRDVLDRAKEKKEKLAPDVCRAIGEQICDGSSYAHNLTDVSGRGLNLVHRDLNPQNVLISYTGDVKIIDFGIAKSEMSTVKTEAGMIKGKFVYMSPEQTLAKKLDKRSDVFAIGITLYEMLTGINPFHKNNIVLSLEAVQRFDPPPPGEYDPAYAPFDPIIAKALAKDRDKRYSDAAEMQDDLRRIVLPRAPERIGQFISRLFRVEVEAEQKVLMETDASKISNQAKLGRTPARPSPRPAPTAPDNSAVAARPADKGNDGEQATMMLAQPQGGAVHQTGARKVAATPARSVPAPRPPPRAPPGQMKPVPPAAAGSSNGDTMIDGENPIANDPALAAAVAKARDSMKAPVKAMTPSKPAPAHAPDDSEGSTQFLGTNNKPPPPARKSAPVAPAAPPEKPITLQVGAEAAAAARNDALAKMASKKVSKSPQKKPGAAAASNKKMWMVVGGISGVALLAVIISVLVLTSSDGPPEKKTKAKPRTAVTEGTDDAASKKDDKAEAKKDDVKAVEAKAVDKKPDAKPDDKAGDSKRSRGGDKGTKVAAAVPSLGKLTLNAAGAPILFGSEQKSGTRFDLAEPTGTITVGDDSTQFKVTLDYKIDGGKISFKVDSKPFSIVSIDGPSKGKTPVDNVEIEKKLTVVELKKPGQPNGMTLRLRFDGP